MDFDGITIDLNRVTRREFREFNAKLKAIPEDDTARREEQTATMYERIIIAWPFGEEISAEAYLNLGLMDAVQVDRAVNEALTFLSEKPGEKK